MKKILIFALLMVSLTCGAQMADLWVYTDGIRVERSPQRVLLLNFDDIKEFTAFNSRLDFAYKSKPGAFELNYSDIALYNGDSAVPSFDSVALLIKEAMFDRVITYTDTVVGDTTWTIYCPYDRIWGLQVEWGSLNETSTASLDIMTSGGTTFIRYFGFDNVPLTDASGAVSFEDSWLSGPYLQLKYNHGSATYVIFNITATLKRK